MDTKTRREELSAAYYNEKGQPKKRVATLRKECVVAGFAAESWGAVECIEALIAHTMLNEALEERRAEFAECGLDVLKELARQEGIEFGDDVTEADLIATLIKRIRTRAQQARDFEDDPLELAANYARPPAVDEKRLEREKADKERRIAELVCELKAAEDAHAEARSKHTALVKTAKAAYDGALAADIDRANPEEVSTKLETIERTHYDWTQAVEEKAKVVGPLKAKVDALEGAIDTEVEDMRQMSLF